MIRPPRELVDVVIALAAAGAIAIEAGSSAHGRGRIVASVAICLALAGPLAARRSHPLAAAAGVSVIAALETWLLTPLTPLVTPIVLALLPPYAVAAYGRTPRRAARGLAVCLLGGAGLELAAPASDRGVAGAVASLAIVLAAWAGGRAVAGRVRRVEELRLLERALVERGEMREQLAISEERAHVARELHDVVAHAMTVICIRAGAARRIWSTDPVQARGAVEGIGATARATLGHVRDVVTLLDPGARSARLGIEDVEALADGARAAGLHVMVVVEGAPRDLPATVGLIAYRVVQEALTNAIRHAAPTDVAVRLVYEGDAIAVDVRDAGRRPDAARAVDVQGSGNGLRGLGERVERLAGAVSFGPLPAGGFAVTARLPLEQP